MLRGRALRPPPLSIGVNVPKIYFEELFDELGCPHPEPAINAFPKWFKDMPKFIDPKVHGKSGVRKIGTIRDCPAVNDAMSFGYTMYLPGDVFIDATGDTIKYDTGTFGDGSRITDAEFDFITEHDPIQTSGYQSMFDFHKQSLKWQTYWGVRTDEGYSTMFIHPMHRNDFPFYSVTAIVDTDRFATRSPYAFFVKKGFKGIIHRGTPMLQVIPFKREDWDMEIVEPDSRNYHKNIQKLGSVFSQPYKKLFWQRKKFN
jgi:hypothetical protein